MRSRHFILIVSAVIILVGGFLLKRPSASTYQKPKDATPTAAKNNTKNAQANKNSKASDKKQLWNQQEAISRFKSEATQKESDELREMFKSLSRRSGKKTTTAGLPLKVREQYEQGRQRFENALKSEASARQALDEVSDCLQTANYRLGLSPGADSEMRAQVSAEMSKNCMAMGKEIVSQYPSLRSEYDRAVLKGVSNPKE